MRVYIADDCWETSNLIKESIRCCNNVTYDFRITKNGKELLDTIHEEGNPDLLILDLAMPVMSGFDVLRTFCSDKARYDFPVIVVTALTEQSRIRQAYELGASDVIIKPFFLGDFVIRTKRVISNLVTLKKNNLHSLQYESLLYLCNIVEAKDGSTGAHIERVGKISFRIAQALGLKNEMCEKIRIASKLHDLGKVAIPDSILQKPGKLTEKEFAIVKTHTIRGAEIIKAVNDVILSESKSVTLYHHEHYNGNGYPFGLAGEKIPLSARIATVADVFDAITHDRVYKKAWSVDQAINHISQQRGEQFDPNVVDAFLFIIAQGG
jgi:putative two-component system response regulator